MSHNSWIGQTEVTFSEKLHLKRQNYWTKAAPEKKMQAEKPNENSALFD